MQVEQKYPDAKKSDKEAPEAQKISSYSLTKTKGIREAVTTAQLKWHEDVMENKRSEIPARNRLPGTRLTGVEWERRFGASG